MQKNYTSPSRNKFIQERVVALRLSLIFFIVQSFFACSNPPDKRMEVSKNTATNSEIPSKPPSSYSDTLLIKGAAVVFYSPDSSQLEQYKAANTKMVFENTTHEYFYLFQNSKAVLKKNWSKLKVFDASKVRYLLFIKTDNTTSVIDLNTQNNIYGMYMFDAENNPQLADMMNIDTELEGYFKEIKNYK